jgi:hypothetical protein
MMEDSHVPEGVSLARRFAPWLAALLLGGAGIGYAVHEHSSAQSLAAQNQQVTSQLNVTHAELDALTAKVNALSASIAAKPAPAPEASPAAGSSRRPTAGHRAVQDSRYKKLQSQVDAQGKAIADARNDLMNTRTELTGSIARTHDELVVLEKQGQRNYFEFDIQKSKQFTRKGPVSVSLRKANTKKQYADLQLMVDDRNLTQKHVNLFQPVLYYQPDSPQPLEIVINDISKDHIHGYISAPKYRTSELAVATSTDGSAQPGPDQANPTAQPPARQKLPKPSPDQP